MASSAGMMTAMRYEITESTWRLVSAPISGPAPSGRPRPPGWAGRVHVRASCLPHLGGLSFPGWRDAGASSRRFRADERRERNSRTQRISSPMPKAIHGAATIRSDPFILPVPCCQCRPVSPTVSTPSGSACLVKVSW
jgi:hypothetical protein